MTKSMSQELTHELVNLRADPEIQNRYDFLAEGHTEGTLSLDEEAELGALVEASAVLMVLKAEARTRLEAEGK